MGLRGNYSVSKYSNNRVKLADDINTEVERLAQDYAPWRFTLATPRGTLHFGTENFVIDETWRVLDLKEHLVSEAAKLIHIWVTVRGSAANLRFALAPYLTGCNLNPRHGKHQLRTQVSSVYIEMNCMLPVDENKKLLYKADTYLNVVTLNMLGWWS